MERLALVGHMGGDILSAEPRSWRLAPGDEALELEPRHRRMVAVEAARRILEPLLVVEPAEVPPEGRRLDDRLEAPGIVCDRPADPQELGPIRHVDAARHEQFAGGVRVEVVALVPPLLAGGPDAGAEVGLVGRLVLREAHVAVDPVDALARRHARHLGLETGDPEDHLLDQLLELRAQALVLGAVRLEPGLAVVGLEPGEELHEAAKVHGSREPTAAPREASTCECDEASGEVRPFADRLTMGAASSSRGMLRYAALRWIQSGCLSGSGSPRALSSVVPNTLFEVPRIPCR